MELCKYAKAGGDISYKVHIVFAVINSSICQLAVHHIFSSVYNASPPTDVM